MAALAPLEPSPLLALAVSGGPDSMALAVLAARWAAEQGGRAHALLVDHRLRPEAGAEAEVAATALRGLGLEADILTVKSAPPAAGRSAWARAIRYDLLARATSRLGALHLLTAHHQDDQAETFLLHLERGSGVKGLAGMTRGRFGASHRLLRPLLGFPKERLVATAAAAGLPVADDPSNRDPAYSRVRARRRLGASGDGARLAATMGRLADEDAALERMAAALAADALSISPLGFIDIDRQALATAPHAVALRVLARAAHAVGGREAPPRQARAADLLAALRGGGQEKRTLAGAAVHMAERRVSLYRAPDRKSAAPPRLTPPGLWDGRFLVSIEGVLPEGAVVSALGYSGLRALESLDEPPPWLGAAPRRALATLPALWAGEDLAAAPDFGAPAFAAGLAMGAKSSLRLIAAFRPRRPIAPARSC